MTNQERSDKSIEDMEKEVSDGEEISVPPPSSEDDPWAGEERKSDEFSERDGEQKVKLYTLSVPNDPVIGGNQNPGFRKLCLDKEFAIAPRDIIRAIILHRIMPNVSQVPYKEAKKIPKKEPWRKYLGYSFDGLKPSGDSDGVYFKRCMNNTVDVPVCWKFCSVNPGFDKDGNPIMKPLADGECPHGRWANTMSDEDRKKHGITDPTAPPQCNNNILLYSWDLDMAAPFVAYFKVTSLGYARDFIASCTRGIGKDIREYPFHAFEAQYSVVDKGEYATAKILNTNKFTEPAKIKPIVKWFNDNKSLLVRNLAIQMSDFRKKFESDTEFNTKDYE